MFSQKHWSFQAGPMNCFVKNWEILTSDREVLETVTGMPINISSLPHGNTTSSLTKKWVHLLKKGIIVKNSHKAEEIISPIFLIRKSDGEFVFIMNLNKLNKSVNIKNWKWILHHQPNTYMTKVNIKDAFITHQSFKSIKKY